MKQLPLLFIFLLIFSCTKKDNSEIENLEIPDCVEQLTIDNQGGLTIQRVRVQKVKNEFHFWLNTDVLQADLTEFVVDEKCNLVCRFCTECIELNCLKDYEYDEWITIWER